MRKEEIREDKDLLKAGICDFFRSTFHCVQLEYTTNKYIRDEAGFIVYNCRVHDQYISGISKDPLVTKCKTFKKRLNS